jgi:hypothetical protein
MGVHGLNSIVDRYRDLRLKRESSGATSYLAS